VSQVVLHPGARPRWRAEVAWARIGDEVVVWDPQRPAAHLLSASGALLWPLFDGSASISALSADVSEVFHIDVDEALEQVREFCQSLNNRGLIDLEGP
jgi:hypothetical protein